MRCKPALLYVYRRRGLSMLELAITITIIGLMLAAVIGAVSMRDAARINRIIAEFTTLESGIREFRDTYKFWPGDIPAASRYWPDVCAALPAGDCNGDGNNAIEFTRPSVAPTTNGEPYEDLTAFAHLSAAGLVKGSFTGQPASGQRYSLGTDNPADANLPGSDAFPRAGFMIHHEYDPVGGKRMYRTGGLTVRAGSIITIDSGLSGLPYGGFVNAEQARSADMKADDGKPASGRIYAIREYDDTTNGETPEGCVTQTWDADVDPLTVEYALTSETASCSMVLWIEKK